jgi:hypothetical protein
MRGLECVAYVALLLARGIARSLGRPLTPGPSPGVPGEGSMLRTLTLAVLHQTLLVAPSRRSEMGTISEQMFHKGEILEHLTWSCQLTGTSGETA